MKKGSWLKKGIASIGLLSLVVATGCSSSGEQAAAGQPKAEATADNSATEATATTGKDFKIGYLPATIDTLFFVAQEEGYFKEEGLNAELIPFGNSGEGLNAVKAGKLDVGAFGTAAPLSFIDKGASDLTIIGGAGGKGNGIIAKPELEKEFQDIQGFKGKKVATVKLSNGDAVWRKGLVDAGIDLEKEVEIVELGSPADVLQSVKKGAVDAGIVWAPFMEMAKEQGLKVVKYTDDYFPGHPCCRQVALSENLKERKDDYKAFFRALLRAEKFYNENKEETIEHIAKYVKTDRKIIEADAYGGDLLISADPNKHGVEEYWEGMKKIDYVQSEENIDKNINTALYEEALNALVEKNPDDAFYQKALDLFKKQNS